MKSVGFPTAGGLEINSLGTCWFDAIGRSPLATRLR